MARNIVVLCDGTGNQIGQNISNVLKLFRCLTTDGDQVAYYDSGVGTLGRLNPWRRFLDSAARVWGLMTGAGLDDNVLDAYRFIAETYRDGDRLFLLGFSRGAYTVRVVAALIHVVGLLRPEQMNLLGYALTAFKKTRVTDSIDAAMERAIAEAIRTEGIDTDLDPTRAADPPEEPLGTYFGRIANARRVPIHFVGVWDTVSSVLVPRVVPILPRFEILANTRNNPSVANFRQAASIDEKRRMFRLDVWLEGQDFDPSGKEGELAPRQDRKEVWFAGYHSDVGGGHAESESAMAKYPLGWMISEAATKGLRFDANEVLHLVGGSPMPGRPYNPYVGPDPGGPIHNSMNPAWAILEWLPKPLRRRQWPTRRGFLGLYLPRSEPRLIPNGALIHSSAVRRRDSRIGYEPVNWPERWEVEG
ncbi:MAG: DUF2235 domain-containing protein [Bauldia sp.]